jgi:geranylgeranylglycerol-phosphate geranylgeranyltransferase
VLLGYWLAGAHFRGAAPFILAAAAALSTGFGNVLNDIVDLESDKINHPERPLPKGEISRSSALIYTGFLIVLALLLAFTVSPVHLAATFIPIVLLVVYAFFLKQTPLAGNLLVAVLVAYSLLFGALGGEQIGSLIIPAVLAFLLNICREIVKDLQDKEGDLALGVTTSAVLPLRLLYIIVYGCALLYVPLMIIPYIQGEFGILYLIICLALTLPLHLVWIKKFKRASTSAHYHGAAKLLKLEMLAGLGALAFDKLW